ncbi:MAG: OmpH family outer membrane protein [Candidatus Muiribacteriota bacterium]
MKKLFVLFAVLGMFFCVEAFSEVGIVDFNQIIDRYEKARNVTEVLKREYDERQKELNELHEELDKRREELDSQRETGKLSDEEFRKKQSDFQVDVMGFQRRAQNFEKELQKMEEEHFVDIKKEVQKVIKKIAEDKKLSLVLEKGVVHMGGTDITGEVIEELNSN